MSQEQLNIMATLDQRITTAVDSIITLFDKLGELATLCTSERANLRNVEAAIRKREQATENMATTLTDIDDRVSNAFRGIKQQVADLTETVSTLEHRLDTLETELGIISNGRVFHLEQTKDDHEGRIDDLEKAGQ